MNISFDMEGSAGVVTSDWRGTGVHGGVGRPAAVVSGVGRLQDIMAWHPLTTDDEIAAFLRLVCDFHDGCVREAHVSSSTFVGASDRSMTCAGRQLTCRLLVQMQRGPAYCPSGPDAIELLFENVVGFHFANVPDDHVAIILGATIVRRDDVYYWCEHDDFDPAASMPNRWETGPTGLAAGPNVWIGAHRLSWRRVEQWLGDTPRYGPSEPA